MACSAAAPPGKTASRSTRSTARDAFRKWLETEGVKNINNVNGKLKAATSWHSIYGVEPALAHA